jgi:transcription-repair coupling factor (superfamily II helicase)
MELILQRIRELPEYRQLLATLAKGKTSHRLVLPRAARLALLTALHEDLSRPVLVITHRADHAISLHDELGFWCSSPRLLFAEPNPLFYESAPWGASTRRDRLKALAAFAAYQMPGSPAAVDPIVVASARSLMTRTIPRREFLNSCLALTQGMSLAPDGLRRNLVATGYERTNTVLEPGQFSSRGGLVDLWPPAQEQPLRLDFFGDEIDAIRQFDPASQRTVSTLGWAFVTPAREYLSSSHVGMGRLDAFQSPAADGTVTSANSEFDIPLLHPEARSMLDFLPANALVLVDDLQMIESMAEEIEDQAVQSRRTAIEEGTLSPDFPLPYTPWSEIEDELQAVGALEMGLSFESPADGPTTVLDFSAHFRHDERFGGRLKPFTDYVHRLVDQTEDVLIVSRQCPRLRELWAEAASEGPLPPGAMLKSATGRGRLPLFFEASLSEGFVLHQTHLITDSEIFGWQRPAPRARPRIAAEAPESFYADLHPGDFVVHIDHGIGRYLGLVQRNLAGQDREYLAVEYEGGGQLFVPVHQADRLSRYVGAEGAEPALDRLGGQEWHEKKGRAKEAVLEVAQEMLDLHARRQVVAGHAFQSDTSWQAELEDSFPYVETEDQVRALADIKRDMEASRPMDRLLCGDVGYGKTEVALRAAFKAVLDGKQAAVLVPTTVLAQQHYETFLERLAAFPVKVEMLSRFRSPREQAEILLGLAAGELDVVIGTHRLLSSDVQFKDLGLVIIDEEQRFGVTHKEHLKQLRTEVDVLTLTATPIPRTLYMALTGVRDISNLNTPPEERLPIVTHVGPYSPSLARLAIMRELERGGQVFFVHNRVDTIDGMRRHLEQLLPEARIDVGHGQMAEHELAEVMHRFNRGETDILLSTTIIESGLDIPNANTLIVDRADTFGLAQLYQLRGRVGRGAARAYAYFFRHRKLPPTEEAQQRLDVIAENTELGAGYSIAMRDLEIRGAGELLGTRQHGHIQAVGFHLYTRLLADAVRQIRRAQGADLPPSSLTPAPKGDRVWRGLELPISMPVNVDLPLAVGIPAAYILDTDLRLRLYRRIADIRDEAEIDAVSGEFQDRFGPPPESVNNLLTQTRMKLRAEKAGLGSIAWEAGQIVLRYPAASNGNGSQRLADLAPDIRGGKGAYWCNFGSQPDWIDRLLTVLDGLAH